jgi:hypothetical protein
VLIWQQWILSILKKGIYLMNYENPHGPRYYSDAQIKERPRNPEEESLRNMLVAQEAKAIIDKHSNKPSYLKALAVELGRHSLANNSVME